MGNSAISQKGAKGDGAYCYIAYASDASGTGFTMTFDAVLNYIAILSVNTPIASPSVSDFAGLWKNYKGAAGADAPTHLDVVVLNEQVTDPAPIANHMQLYGLAVDNYPITSNTKLMLYCDGENNGTTITDSALGKTITRYGCVTSTTQKKSGVSSLYFDGTDDYITIPNHADFLPGDANFTYDLWLYRTDGTKVDRPITMDGGASNFMFSIWIEANTHKMCTAFSYTGSTWANNGDWSGGTYTCPPNGWHHLAVVRDGASLKNHVDGHLDKTWNVGTNALYATTVDVMIGKSATYYTKGYKDNIRWTLGEALWTADFTPPVRNYYYKFVNPDGSVKTITVT